MIPRSYASHSQERAQDLAAAILSASSPPQIVAACSAVEDFLRGDPANQARPFFSIAFPALICRLFGFDGPSPTSSRSPSPSSAWIDQADPELAARVFDLLSTRGILLSAIAAADRQCPIKFVFPVERLPEWMRFVLQSEKHFSALPDLCPLFRSRVKEDAVQGSFQLQLNVFEYFIFWFAYYPVCRGKSENSDAQVVRKSRRFNLENWTSSWSCPASSSRLSLPKKGCGLYLKLLYEYLRAFVPKQGQSSCQPYRSSLFHCSSISDDSVNFQAEFVVHTLVHFWMVENDFSPLPQSLCSSLGVSFPSPPLLAETPPTPSLGEALRLLVIYLNRPPGDQPGDLGRKRMPSSSDNLAGSWNSVIQRPLYRFILRSFLFCPVETAMENAEQVVLLWTSFMEPWEMTSDVLSEFEAKEDDARKEKVYSSAWQAYVTSNYLFYNSLFVHFLGFAHKFLHANAEKIVLMVLKVLDVMTASRELMNLVKKVDAAYHSKPAAASPALPDAALFRVVPSIRQQLQDWEHGLCESEVDGSFLHENWNRDLRLFGDGEDGAHWLLQLFILRAEAEVQSLPGDRLARSLRDIGAVRAKMGLLFDGPVRRAQPPPAAQAHAEAFSPKHPGGTKWVSVKYKGDWMRRPISDGEVAWLAELLIGLSAQVNAALGLDHAAPGDEPAGPVVVDLGAVTGPREALQLVACWMGTVGQTAAHYLRKRGVRVNLRPLASKKLVLALVVTVMAAVLIRAAGEW